MAENFAQSFLGGVQLGEQSRLTGLKTKAAEQTLSADKNKQEALAYLSFAERAEGIPDPEMRRQYVSNQVQAFQAQGKDTTPLQYLLAADTAEESNTMLAAIKKSMYPLAGVTPPKADKAAWGKPEKGVFNGKPAFGSYNPDTGAWRVGGKIISEGEFTPENDSKGYSQPFTVTVDGKEVLARTNKDTNEIEVVEGFGPKLAKGTRITQGADGAFTIETGIPMGEPTKPTVNEAQKKIVEGKLVLDALDMAADLYEKDFLRYLPKAEFTMRGVLEKSPDAVKKFGEYFMGEETPEKKQRRFKFNKFISQTYSILNKQLKLASGVAINPQEADRLMKEIPSAMDDPTEYLAKAQTLRDNTQRALAVYSSVLKSSVAKDLDKDQQNGIAERISQLARKLKLNPSEEVKESVARELWSLNPEWGGFSLENKEGLKQLNLKLKELRML